MIFVYNLCKTSIGLSRFLFLSEGLWSSVLGCILSRSLSSLFSLFLFPFSSVDVQCTDDGVPAEVCHVSVQRLIITLLEDVSLVQMT